MGLLKYIEDNINDISNDFKEDYNLTDEEKRKVIQSIHADDVYLEEIWEALNKSFDRAIKTIR